MRKIIVLALVAAAVLYGLYRAFWGGAGEQGQMGPAPVSVAEVLVRDTTEWVEFSGRLEAVHQADIRPRVMGTVDKIYFTDGQIVQKGDKLIQIDPKPYRAALEQANGQLASATSLYTNAKIEYDRALPLVEAGAISRRDFDTRKSAFRAAEGAVKAAKGEQTAAKLNLEYTEVRAPFTGKVGRAEITVGNLLNTNMEPPILTKLVAFSPIYAAFAMDEQSYLSLVQPLSVEQQKNIPVEVGLSNQKDTPYKGKLQGVDNVLDVSTGTLRARAILDNADGALIPGLFARVRIGTGGGTGAVLVNEKAISTDQNKKFVYVIGANNLAEYREVMVGQSNDGLTVIRSGLKAGEKVVVNGLMRVMPGAPVTPELVDMATLEPKK